MARRWEPGLVDVVFGVVLALVLVGGRQAMLNDPGTLWHLRLGRDVLSTGHVPRVGTLTYTRESAEWVDQSWLFDVGLALAVDHGGWSLAVALAALGLATIYAGLASSLARDGYSPVAVVVVSVVAAGVGAIHFLVRPHLLTLGFFLMTLRLCRAQHERGGCRVFWVVPLMVIWANVHGGFLAGPVVVLTAAIGHALSGAWDRDRARQTGVFLIATGLCGLAALVNPYGIGLYGHVGRLLVSSGVTDLIDEYQPIPFGKPHARAVELTVIALIALPTLTAHRMRRYDLVQSLVWLHLSLTSVRNAPLFALAVAPGLCGLLAGRSETDESISRWSFWPMTAACGMVALTFLGVTFGRFDRAKWPLDALATVNAMPVDAPLFHEQDWGGLVESETRPVRRAFVDDRFELFGREALLQYLNAIEGGPDWETLSDRYATGLVWVRPTRGLARRLLDDPAWRVRYRDEVSILFQRVGPARRDTAAGLAGK